MLASRRARREEALGVHLPDPIVGPADRGDPETEALLADAVGFALQVVVDRLAPVERLAFVLHDIFAVPYADIAPIVGRTPATTRQLASRARRRVRGASDTDASASQQRALVDAFLAAARRGDFDALLALLDPDVVLRGDGGIAAPALSREIRGARFVAQLAVLFARVADSASPVSVNGTAGVLSRGRDGRSWSLLAFGVRAGRINEIDVLADSERIRGLHLPAWTVDTGGSM